MSYFQSRKSKCRGVGRLHGFQRYHIRKGGNGFLNRFFFCVVKYKHDYFCDKSHLLLGRLSVKAELEQGSDKPPFDIVLAILVDVSVFKGSKPDSLAVMP